MARNTSNTPKSGFFVLKHVGLFAGMALLILVVDIFLYIAIGIFESSISYHDGNDPNSTESEARIHVSDVANSLSKDEQGTWSCNNPDLLQTIANQNGWALVVDSNGNIDWTYNTPDEFPTSFTQNDIAVIAHDRAYSGYITFIWTKDSDLVMMGYPDSQYIFYGITLSSQAFLRIPLYFLLIFTIDLLIIFLLYVFSQRAVMKTVGPTLDALDNLAQGKPTHVRFGGVLHVVGNRINAVSDTLIRKETARKNWVAGVSHDVRTPLAVAMGHAERIENDQTLPESTRESAATITRQGIRIRDLIEDLNIATQLEYDMQPLKIDTIVLSKLLRSIVVDYLNQGIDDAVSIDLDIAESAATASIKGDERLLKRALRNAVDNSIKHNPGSCHITISLNTNPNGMALCVADEGRGMNQEQLYGLATMLEQDYLGAGSLTSSTETSITFSQAQAFIPAERKPGSPELPPDNTSKEYSTEAPRISSQKAPIGTPPIPPKKSRPPEPPVGVESTQLNDATPYSTGGTTPFATSSADAFATTSAAPFKTAAKGGIPHGGSIGKHGLGLPLIARIVLVHEGILTIASAEGEGFTIIMTFPQLKESAN